MRIIQTERDKRLREQNRINSEIVETDVKIISLISLRLGKCGSQDGYLQTMDYNPCRIVMKDKEYIADIKRNGSAIVKLPIDTITLSKGQYKKVSNPLKNKKWILYVVLAVGGYFAYKKFKK